MLNLTQPFLSYHYIDPRLKNSKWAADVIYELYSHGQAKNLLSGKNPDMIRKYATGQQDVNKYRRMFRRQAKEIDQQLKVQAENILGDLQVPTSDLTGIDWQQLGLLATPLNAALNNIKKQPIYVKCTALDGLAQTKKQHDYDLLKNRPVVDKDASMFSELLGVAIDPPSELNNSEGIDISNFGLDPQRPDELNFYMNLFYKLRPESAFENVLRAFAYAKKLKQIKDLEARDQMYYGVSANRAFFSDITGLPDVKYLYPGDVFTVDSDLPDHSDVPFIYIKQLFTAEEIVNEIGNEFEPEELERIFQTYFDSRGWERKWNDLTDREKGRQRIPICYFEFKSWDAEVNHRLKSRVNGHWIRERVTFEYRLRYSNHFPDRTLRGKEKPPTEEDFLEKKYAQNTYTGYWIPSYPEKAFKFKKLEGSYRTSGNECMSPYSINIEKTQVKSAVELCIPIIDDAQRAYFKMQHCVIMSKPKGAFYDYKYLRNAVNMMKETDLSLSMTDLVNILADNNVMIGDSEGMDPSEQQSGARPYYEIPGGVGREIEGYLLVIKDCIEKIGRMTGINDQLTGTGTSPEGLIGLQKLLLQSSLNTIYYAQDAMKNQTEKVFRMWANLIQVILKHRGSPAYNAVERIVGAYKMEVLADLHTIAAHRMGIMVENAPSEEEQSLLNQMMFDMARAGRISSSDYFTIKRIFNYKDAAQLLAIKERKEKERLAQERREQYQSAEAIAQNREQSRLAGMQMMSEGEVKEEMVKADLAKWLAIYNTASGVQKMKMEGNIKKFLQDARGADQLNKARETANQNAQKPLGVS